MKYLTIVLLFLFGCGEYNPQEKSVKISKDFAVESSMFKVDTVRNPNNGFLYYYFDASILGHEKGQYIIKMEDGKDHITCTVNGKPGFLIWCLNNWEHYTDSLRQNQIDKVALIDKYDNPK